MPNRVSPPRRPNTYPPETVRVSPLAAALATAALACGAGLCAGALPGCGGAAAEVVVTPMTAEHEAAFENGVDFIDDPRLLEGSWLETWESEIEHRVTLSDAIGVVRITTVRHDTDLEHHDTYHLVATVVSTRYGTMPGEVSLTTREGESGFGTVAGNDERLLAPPADRPEHFILFLKWTRDDSGDLVARWHLSPAGTAVVQRVNSLVELRRRDSEERRRVIVHTTSSGDDEEEE